MTLVRPSSPQIDPCDPWAGDTKLAGELRLRVAKFGATPEDRARLKIQFAAADEAEDRTERRRTGVAKPSGEDPRLKLMG